MQIHSQNVKSLNQPNHIKKKKQQNIKVCKTVEFFLFCFREAVVGLEGKGEWETDHGKPKCQTNEYNKYYTNCLNHGEGA